MISPRPFVQYAASLGVTATLHEKNQHPNSMKWSAFDRRLPRESRQCHLPRRTTPPQKALEAMGESVSAGIDEKPYIERLRAEMKLHGRPCKGDDVEV